MPFRVEKPFLSRLESWCLDLAVRVAPFLQRGWTVVTRGCTPWRVVSALEMLVGATLMVGCPIFLNRAMGTGDGGGGVIPVFYAVEAYALVFSLCGILALGFGWDETWRVMRGVTATLSALTGVPALLVGGIALTGDPAWGPGLFALGAIAFGPALVLFLGSR